VRQGGFIWWALRGRGGRVSRRIRRDGGDHPGRFAVFVPVSLAGMTGGTPVSAAREESPVPVRK
jgi:hypothetical protein